MNKSMTKKEAEKLLFVLKQQDEDTNSRRAEYDDSSYFIELFGLMEDEEMNCEYIAGRLYPDEPEILIHNVNHFRLASPSRRMEQEFGLGAPPNDRFYESDQDLKPMVSKKEAQKEESLVSCLDWLCAIEGGYSLAIIFADPKPEDLQILHSWGIITKKGAIRKKALRKESHKIAA